MRASAAPADASRSLAQARVAIGALFLLRTTPLLGLLDPAVNDARPLLGWPVLGAATGGFVPASVVAAFAIVRTAALVAFTLGIEARAAGLAAAASGAVVLWAAPFAFTSTQELFVIATFVLALADSGAALALRPRPAVSPASSAWLVRGFVASVYAWAGIAKLRADWLDGRTLLLFHDLGRLSGRVADALFATQGRAAVVAVLVAAAELSLAPLLLARRTRALGVGIAASMHLGIEAMARPDVIGWAMLALLIVFIDLPPRPVGLPPPRPLGISS